MTDERRAELIEECSKLMFVRVTAEHIDAGQSSRGGWSEEQFKCIGVAWPPAPGWKRVIGTRLPGSDVVAFIRLRDAHL